MTAEAHAPAGVARSVGGADAGVALGRVAGALWALLFSRVDFEWLLYSLRERLQKVSKPWRVVTEIALVTVSASAIFAAFFLLFTGGGERWVINPLISEFEFPFIPEHARKVYACCKYLFAVSLSYNLIKYVIERKSHMLALMDALEQRAAASTGLKRQDASVPKANDDPKTREARALIAMRRLYWRGVFTFDVVAEAPPCPSPEPTEDEIRLIREALELEAVKKLNDPKMLREYIRRRESRLSRRKVHLTKNRDRRKATSKKTLRIDTRLKVIKEEESSPQQSDQEKCLLQRYMEQLAAPRRPPSRERSPHSIVICEKPEKEMESDSSSGRVSVKRPMDDAELRGGDGLHKRSRSPIKEARWPVSGSTRVVKLRACSPGTGQSTNTKYLVAPSPLPSLSPPESRPTTPTLSRPPTPPHCGGERGRSKPSTPLQTIPEKPSAKTAPRGRDLPSGAASRRGSAVGQRRTPRGSAKSKAAPTIVWDSLSQTMTSMLPPPNPPAVVCPPDTPRPGSRSKPTASSCADGTARCAAALKWKGDESKDALDETSGPSFSESSDEDETTLFSSGDSTTASLGARPGVEDLPKDTPGEDEGGEGYGQRCGLEIAALLQPRGGWSDSMSSLSGLSQSLTSTLTAFSDITTTPSITSDDDSPLQDNY